MRTELQRRTSNTVHFQEREGTDDITYAGASAAAPLQKPTDGEPVDIARGFVDGFAPLFGVSDPADLRELSTESGTSGDAVKYQQTYHDVPVIAGEVAVQLDDRGAVLSVTGEASPKLAVDTTATVSAADAAASALAVAARADRVDPTSLSVSAPELWIYDPSLIGATDVLGTRLVWRTEARDALGSIDRLVLVDAHDGTIVLHFSQVEAARNRQVCDNGNDDSKPVACATPFARVEGGPATGISDVDRAYDFAGDTYDFYAALGRDSLNGAGMTLKSTVRYCEMGESCPYDNAFWSGTQMVYGEGYASSDDVVGHELTHGVTQFTSGLFYYADAGAINESMSDVMGEFIDQANVNTPPDPATDNWKLGEALPGGSLRNMADPTMGGSPLGDPDRMTSSLFRATQSDNRGVHHNSGVNNKAAYLIAAGGAFNGHNVLGIGNDKAARIYYQAEATLLTPGSDYLDLSNILPQACTNLIGTAGIVAGDCDQVRQAVLATEMNLRATKPGASLTAPVCSTGTYKTSTPFSDDMEANNGNWLTSKVGANAANWAYTTASSQSGTHSVFVEDRTQKGTSTLTGTVPIVVPADAGTTPYLRFDHSFHTDAEYFNDTNTVYDGGFVEFSSDNGVTWKRFTSEPVDNGPLDLIDDSVFNGQANAFAGTPAFGGVSPNYQTTRWNLSSLRGQTIKIRFRFSTDNFFTGSFPGWFIDDVSVYGCSTGFTSFTPVRLLDTRSGGSTIDGQFNDIGVRPAGSVLALTVAGRGGINADATAAVLNVTATGSTLPGFVTVFPCGAAIPTASNLNFTAGSITPNAVVAKIGTGGQVCLFTNTAVHLIVDASSFFSPGSSLTSLVPARLLESRHGLSTIDGVQNDFGIRPAGSVTTVQVTGRAGVPVGAAAAVLNVTVTEPQAPGFATVFPCGGPPPTASNLNYGTGSTIANATVTKLSATGTVCVFAQATLHLVVDVNGYFPAGADLTPINPARLLDSRASGITVDGQGANITIRPGGSVTEVQVIGRADVPATATAVVLNVTATEATAPGFATVYPCGGPPPTASNLNFVANSTVPNAVITKIGAGGKVCVFVQSTTHLIVDVNAYFTG